MTQHYDDLFQRLSRSINTPITEFLPPAHFSAPMIIHNLLPTGLTLLTGASRSGRTSLALHLALDIATGEPALNSRIPSLHDDHQPYRTAFGSHVHYLALDSSEENLQQTTDRLFKPRSLQTSLKLTLNNTLDTLTSQQGLLDLHSLFSTRPTSLLVIDSLAAFRKGFPGSDHDLLDALRRLAETCQMSILVLHTGRRSTPLSAHVDHHWHLSRLPISDYYRLETRCRNLKPATHLLHCPSDALSFRFASLSEITSLNTISAHKVLSPERLTILHLIHTSDKALTPRQLAATLDFDDDCMRQVLSKMHKVDLLTTSDYGHYNIHPFIKSLMPALLEEVPILPLLTLNEIPPDDLNAAIPHTSHDPNLNATIPHIPDPGAISPHTTNTQDQLDTHTSHNPNLNAAIPHTSISATIPSQHTQALPNSHTPDATIPHTAEQLNGTPRKDLNM